MIGVAEYIWLDGAKPTQKLRSKARIVEFDETCPLDLKHFPEWSYDGSSTYQAEGGCSDLLLQPVKVCSDPIRGPGNFLVLCEVLDHEKRPHLTNTRAILRKIYHAADGDRLQPWVGFEQEYTMYRGHTPLGWPEHGYPRPQGPFYCGVGADNVFGRQLVEEHLSACIEAGLSIYGVNAEVMPGQWEFQIGYRGFANESCDVFMHCDELWIGRWLLDRMAEDFDVTIRLDNKPVPGDWNGAGCHCNFSTAPMRCSSNGMQYINNAIEKLREKHDAHIAVYGYGLKNRLTGNHETCSIEEFRSGVADRAASIRIPQQVQLNGAGYLEDRRPGANCDPYLVAARLISTIAEVDAAQLIQYQLPIHETEELFQN